MATQLDEMQAQLNGALARIERLEKIVDSLGIRQQVWRFLSPRQHPWRRQLYVNGRNMTVGQLVSTVRANRLTPQQAAEDLELPVEAIEEALLYYDQNRELIQNEAAEERRFLAEAGVPLEPADLSR
jgi:uncharacterized protein (DUF433 family)